MTSLQGKRTVIVGLAAVCAVAVVGATTLSQMLSQSPVIAPEVTQEEPAKPAGFSVPDATPAGCWEVRLSDAALSARWVEHCDPAGAGTPGTHAWREGVIRLPGAAGAVPKMDHAQAQAEFSEDLALAGAGALLFLPISAAGAGYYVAAWAQPLGAAEAADDAEAADGAPAPVTRGYQVGRYGAPPASVLTPAGRIYLRAEYSPRRAAQPEPFPAEDAASSVLDEPQAPAGMPTT